MRSHTVGWYWLDPTVALLIAVVIGYNALTLLRKIVTALTSATDTPRAADDL
jgi:divalent metal cation (Fe/Co/Zn/Cd) transporter